MKRYLCLLVAFVMTFYGIAAYAEQLVAEQEQYFDEMAQEEIEFSQNVVDALNGEEAVEEDCVFLQDSEEDMSTRVILGTMSVTTRAMQMPEGG